MTKITLDGYIIDVNDLTIEFSATPNFSAESIDYILNPETGAYYYVRPRPPLNWGTWSGSKFKIALPGPIAKLRPTTRLICLSDPQIPA